jgi:hypothetical protein
VLLRLLGLRRYTVTSDAQRGSGAVLVLRLSDLSGTRGQIGLVQRHLAWRRTQVGLRPLSGKKDVFVTAIRKGLAHT